MIIITRICILFCLWGNLVYGSFLVEERSSSAASPVVKVFPVGQGNCVAVKYHGKVIVVDMGSTEHTFQHFYKQRAFSEGEYSFEVRKDVSSNIEPVSFSSESGTSNAMDVVSSSPSSRRESAYSQSSEESTHLIDKSDQSGVEMSWKSVIGLIREFLSAEDIREIVFVGSHSDKDHVGSSLIRSIFFEEKVTRNNTRMFSNLLLQKLKYMILGGFPEEYSHINDGLKILKEGNKDLNIIFTASYDGKSGRPLVPNTPWIPNYTDEEPKYARPYCSFIDTEERTHSEREIEEALKFPGDGLKVQILAMNAGHSVHSRGEEHFATIANRDPNSNSIVLRFLREGGQSFLIPGDADYATWNYISIYGSNLNTDYMLVSHHGSAENEATRMSVLELFNPKCFIISSGHHEGYHHPHGETIDLIRKYFDSRGFRTGDHELTYYRGVEEGRKVVYYYKRSNTKRPIFSTVVNGEIKFRLETEDDLVKVTVSQTKPRLFIVGEKRFIMVDQVKSLNDRDEGLLADLNQGADICLWREDKETRTLEGTTYHSISKCEDISSSASSSISPPEQNQETVNVVVRRIPRRDFYIYYIVEPVEDETEGESSSGGAAGSSSAQ